MRGLEKALLEAEAGNALFSEKEKTNKKNKKISWQRQMADTCNQHLEAEAGESWEGNNSAPCTSRNHF